jgi:PAS domain S-box-containing protein
VNIMPAMASSRPESEALNIQLLVDSIPALIHTGRPDGYLDYFNKPWLEYLGVSLEKVAGWNWTSFIHPEDVDGIVAKWRGCLASGEVFEYETRVRRADGEYRWMFHRKVPLRDERSNIVKWYGSSLDIEERKTTEAQLRRNTDALQRSEFYLAEGQRLGHMGSWAFDPDGFSYWSPELFRMHGLEPAGQAPSVQEYLGLVHPQDQRAMADLINRLVADDTPFDATKRIVRPDGEVRYIRCAGVPFVDGHSLKKYVGSAIDVTEHELLTEELRRREAYLAEAQRLSHTGSFGWKVSSGELFWSDESYRIFEHDRAVKPTLDSLAQRVHPEDRADVKEVINRASAGASEFEHAYRLLLPDGRVKHVHALAHVLEDASGNREFVGAVTDVTAHMMAQEALRSSEADLLEAQRLSHTGSWRNDVSTGIVTVSPEVHRIFDIRPGEDALTPEFFFGRIHPEDRPIEVQTYERASLAKTDFESDYRIVLPDGSIKYVHNIGHPVLNESGDIRGFVGTVIDITERRRAEAVIREQDAELRQMLDLAPQHVRVYGPGGERLYANRIALDYYGVTFEEWQQTSGNAFRSSLFVHPDDQKRVAREFDANRSSGSAYESEVRVRGADGNYRWFLVRYNPLHDDKGQVKRWYLALTDIEDRKQAEDRLRQENVALREEIDKASMFEEIVGTSRPLRAVLSRIAKVAPTDSTVLITGETGTGKELVARAIHRRSRRSSRAFVCVNCAAIPRDLIASELFGHEKGSFTGALQRRVGKFELAEGGTIFLDEVGELPTETQIALLRVLQEREFDRVGGNHPIRANVRVIAATNRDLEACVTAGSFRRDLFYRINVFPMENPPLRQRKDDIPVLVEYFIDRYARKAGKNIKRVNKKTLELFQAYPWPGNIRELQNVIERSVILCDTEIFSIDENWLPQPPLTANSKQQAELPQTLLAQEKEMIEAALKDARGRVSGSTGAAVKLGIPRSTLESKIRSLRIDKNRFRTIPGT